MADKNSDKTLSYFLEEIAKKSEYLENYPDGSVVKNASLIKEDFKELRNGFKGIKISLLFLFYNSIFSYFFSN